MKYFSNLIAIFLFVELIPLQIVTGTSLIKIDCQNKESYSYAISSEKDSWDESNDTCVLQGGVLFTTLYRDALTNEISAIVRGYTGEEYYWTGWKRIGNTGVFQSNDGNNLTAFHDYWKDYNPIDDVDCVGFDGAKWKHLSLQCHEKHTFVCKQDFEINNNPRGKEFNDSCSSQLLNTNIPTEETLMNLNFDINVTTGDYIHFHKESIDLVVTKVSANETTYLPINGNTVQISKDPYQVRETYVWSTSRFLSWNLTNIVSDILTIYTSNNSTANLTVDFEYNSNYESIKCVYLRFTDGNWTTVYLDADLSFNKTVRCTTTIEKLSTLAVTGEKVDAISWHNLGLFVLGIILYIISALLLLSSIIIFIVSGRKFFSHDINVLHFSYTLVLFMAIASLLALPIFISIFKGPTACNVILFFPNFLWINTFLSSLAIAVVVFYSIWIVSIKHTARKLSIVLIPSCWGISLVWGVSWALDRHFNKSVCMNINLPFLGVTIAILFCNIILLTLSLVKVWLAFKKMNREEGELKRLRKVAIGGLLLIPALSLNYISLLGARLYRDPSINDGANELTPQNSFLLYSAVFLINSPVGILHFLSITCQIKETVIRKYCRCSRRSQPQKPHSLHFNVRKPPQPNRNINSNNTQDTNLQQYSDDCIQESVHSNVANVYSNNSDGPIN